MEFITPIPKPKRRKGAAVLTTLTFDGGKGLSTAKQQYDQTALINVVRFEVDKWRGLANPVDWRVTPETAIWLTQVAPKLGKSGARLLESQANANRDANPELMRLALKLATGAGEEATLHLFG